MVSLACAVSTHNFPGKHAVGGQTGGRQHTEPASAGEEWSEYKEAENSCQEGIGGKGQDRQLRETTFEEPGPEQVVVAENDAQE